MEQFRVYDRQTLSYVDGGVIKDYKIDTNDFIEREKTQIQFDKDVFNKLVNSVTIKDADDIVFLLRDGTILKGVTKR